MGKTWKDETQEADSVVRRLPYRRRKMRFNDFEAEYRLNNVDSTIQLYD